MKTIVGGIVLVFGTFAYLLSNSSDFRDSVGGAVASVFKPVLIPVVELINVPAFIYCAALTIFLAGIGACVIHRVRSVAPRLAEFRIIRNGVRSLPMAKRALPGQVDSWPDARHQLGDLLQERGGFVAAWSAFLSESIQIGGIPRRPFSNFAAAEPPPEEPGEDFFHALPSYFTSAGLILTFLGLVVALYFAAKGFRSGDLGEARAAIIQLLNAASFKFLTSVAALISAFIVSLYSRYTTALVAKGRSQTMELIEVYLASWREIVGSGRSEPRLEPTDLLSRFDALLAGVAALSADVRQLIARSDARPQAEPARADDVPSA